MDKQDILFKTDAGIFSFRVAGILIRAGKVLLQRPLNHATYAFPGGHVNFGEVAENAVVREFKEEIAADIGAVRLLWVGENFFPLGEKDFHQVCFYYLVTLRDETQIPLDRDFFGQDELERERCELEFSWWDLANLEPLSLHPIFAKEKLKNLSELVEHFVYVENPTKDT